MSFKPQIIKCSDFITFKSKESQKYLETCGINKFYNQDRNFGYLAVSCHESNTRDGVSGQWQIKYVQEDSNIENRQNIEYGKRIELINNYSKNNGYLHIYSFNDAHTRQYPFYQNKIQGFYLGKYENGKIVTEGQCYSSDKIVIYKEANKKSVLRVENRNDNKIIL